MPKISELVAVSNVSSDDLLLVVNDPGGAPSTNKITIQNFANHLVGMTRYANTTVSGVIKVGDNLYIDADGFLNASNTANGGGGGGAEGIYALTIVDSVTRYVVDITDVILFVNPNSVDSDITIVLPTTGVVSGQEFLVKNINPGANHKVTVITDAGEDFGSNYIEDPITGAFTVSHIIANKGESHTWIWDGTVYRSLAQLSDSPVFYAATDNYHQVAIVNPSYANNASADLVAYNDQGNYANGTGKFIDMGINSSQYTDTFYGNVWKQNDGYLYNAGGDLIIGPQTNNTIKFVAGNTNIADIRLTINNHTTAIKNRKVTLDDLDGPYASDSAANAAGIPVKGLYFDSSGNVKVRLT